MRSVTEVTVSRRPIDPQSPPDAIIQEELALLARVEGAAMNRTPGDEPIPGGAYDQELISLRDQIAEAKPEDIAPLVEQMSRVAALAAGRRREAHLPIDRESPYFAHMRLREAPTSGSPVEGDDAGHLHPHHAHAPVHPHEPRVRDILIGRAGFIDRASGVQVVDWRDAPVSQIYYRYDEGDDYDEVVERRRLEGVVEARRNVTIHRAALRRIGCPQGTFVADGEGRWWEAEGLAQPTLAGGQGKAARPPREAVRPVAPKGPKSPKTLGVHSGPVPRADKHLPEIAALIDPRQFELITAPSTGLVVIQGGAGSGKTTVALHRVAYLTYNDPGHFKPSRCLIVVPTQALERYVAGVLPALGVRSVPVVTFKGWARTTRRKVLPNLPDRYTEETPQTVSRIKKHPTMLGILARYVEDRVAAAGRELIAAAHTTSARAKLGWAWEARKHKPPMGRLVSIGKWLSSPEAELDHHDKQRIELALARVRKRMRDLPAMWAELLTDEGRLREGLPKTGEEPIRDDEIREVVAWVAAQQDEPLTEELADVDVEARTPVDGGALDDTDRGRAAGRLDAEDDALLLRLAQLVHGALYRTDRRDAEPEVITYDHIAIDEAQDLSAVEIKVLYEAAADHVTPGAASHKPAHGPHVKSLTLAGDVAQRLVFDNAFHGWDELLADIGLGGVAVVRPLHLSYRSTEEVMRFARHVLGPLATEEDVIARPGAPVELHRFDAMGEAVAFLAEALRSLAGREPTASIALIARYPAIADAWYNALARAEIPSLRRVKRQDFVFAPGVDVTDVAQVKGLEFDYVVLLDVTPANYPIAVEARHMLHIGATRAAHQLWLISVGTPSGLVPEELMGAAE